MSKICVVYGCLNRFNRYTTKRFYRVPKTVPHKGEDIKNLTKRRREKWLENLHLQLNRAKSSNACVCSDHFVKGRPSALDDVDSVDWAPTVNLGYQKGQAMSEALRQSEERIKSENRKQRRSEALLEPQESAENPEQEDIYEMLHGRQDDQQLFVCKEEWSPSMDQEEPEPPHIKEEKEELWTSQEGEQLRRIKEADIKFTFNPDPVKSEYDEEEQTSHLKFKAASTQTVKGELLASTSSRQIKREADGEDCGVSEAVRNLDPAGGLEPLDHNTQEITTANNDGELDINMYGHIKPKPFDCTICKKNFVEKSYIKVHMRIHTGERPFRCTLCTKDFTKNGDLTRHMKCHTEEKHFRCSVCNDYFKYSGYLTTHMKIHNAEELLHSL